MPIGPTPRQEAEPLRLTGPPLDLAQTRRKHPRMPNIKANDITIEYEVFGDPSKPALLLVCGLGGQLIDWDERLCQQLVDRGFFVIRYDNRDTGLSQKFDAAGAPDMGAVFAAAASGEPITTPYSLNDMADDGIALLGALGIDKAHLVGASMGGMIVQAMAIRHPAVVRSLCSIMSTTGDPSVGQPTPEAMSALLQPMPTTREEAVEALVVGFKVVASPGYPTDEPLVRQRAQRTYERCFYPVGAARQLAAVIAGGDRTAALGAVTVPTVVIHGDADPLVTPSGGEATAKAIPGSELVMVPGLGHDFPEAVWPAVLGAVVSNAGRAPG